MICPFSNPRPGRNGRNGRVTTLYTPWPVPPRAGDLPSGGEVHTVFSASGSVYQRWQADLLAYSHRRIGQPGPLSRLLSADERSAPFVGRTFQTAPYSPHPLTGDDYTPYNKPKALRDWLWAAPPEEEAVLILDPDCIFLKPVAGSAIRGRPLAQPMGYLNPAHENNRELVGRHCQNSDSVQGVGIPILIHKDDLAALAPLWLQKTEEIRGDPKSRETAGWVAEMWAYAFAAAELGLRHTMHPLARVSSDDRADLPILHYCYPYSDPEVHWRWDKRAYTPWERVPDPPDEVPLGTKVLIDSLNEWVATQEHQICL